MPRYIDMSDRQKAAVQLAAIRKIDFEAWAARIRKEFEEVKATEYARPKTKERLLDALRQEWVEMKRQQRWAVTGRKP